MSATFRIDDEVLQMILEVHQDTREIKEFLKGEKREVLPARVTMPERGKRCSDRKELCAAADGPMGSSDASSAFGRFRWLKQVIELRGLCWRLLRCLWLNRQVDFASLGEIVWGDDTTSDSAIRTPTSRKSMPSVIN